MLGEWLDIQGAKLINHCRKLFLWNCHFSTSLPLTTFSVSPNLVYSCQLPLTYVVPKDKLKNSIFSFCIAIYDVLGKNLDRIKNIVKKKNSKVSEWPYINKNRLKIQENSCTFGQAHFWQVFKERHFKQFH